MSIDISPSPEELIGEMERDGFNWTKALAEMIDNAFDEDANRVVITSHGKSLSVVDNGNGCPSPENMLRKGYSTKRSGRVKLGRYGVGLKHASFYICGTVGDTQIVTVHGGMLRMAFANWGRIIQSGHWAIDDPTSTPATLEDCVANGMSSNRGTMLKFGNTKRSLPTGKILAPIIEELSFMFTPALERGRQIIIESAGKQHVLEPPKVPELIESIDRQVSIGNKTARIRAGIVTPGTPNRKRGLSYFSLHRVIVQNSGHGCTGYPISHITGTVELNHAWKLGQNKTSVSDDDWDRLGTAVLREMRPLLEKATQQASYIASDQLRTSLEAVVNEQLGRARRPNRTGAKGTKSPVGTERVIRRASVVSGPGVIRGPRTVPAGRVELEFIDSADDYICDVDITSNRVTLNRHFPFVREIADGDNQHALTALVFAAFVNSCVASGATKVLPTMPDEDSEKKFLSSITKLLGTLSLESKPQIAVAS